MNRCLLATLLAASLLSGCVFVPTVPTMASIDQVTLVVPLPDGMSATSALTGGTKWHRARLMLTNADGRNGDLVQNLVAVKGGLKAKAPLRNLPPGSGYHMAMELIQDLPDGNERIVARGALGDDETPIKLSIGPNKVKMPVQPTFAGGLLSLQPEVIEPKTKSSSKSSTKITFGDDDEDEDEDEDDDSSASTKSTDDVGDVLVKLIAAVAVEALLGDSKSKKSTSDTSTSKSKATTKTKTTTDTVDIWSAIQPAN